MHDDHRLIAFDLFYTEHARSAYRFALRLCGDPDDAEDLTAEAFAKAYRRWSQFRGEAHARSWLFAIVLNEWKMLCRKRPNRESCLDDAREVAGALQDADFELAEAIGSLPEKLRIAFLLVKGEGLTHAEAAKAMHVPVGTMYYRVHTAVAKLRGLLVGSGCALESNEEVPAYHEV